ncbi:MAG TPA: hypothetical protein VG826_05450 [Pirellulales bacterium]|nr:hypothetical protein [Pirellulales bacterium]
MSKNNFLVALPVLAVFALAGGCGRQPAMSHSAGAHASNEAGHGEAGHDHDADGHEGHDHAELGPHGGHLIELGDEAYHAEILHDDDTHAVSVYLLDSKAENTVAIAAPEITIDVKVDGDSRRFRLTAVHLGQDDTSRNFCFESIDEDLCHALDEEDSQSVLSVDIEGQSFTGTIAHVHDHDHGHEHDHADAAHNGHRR